MKDRIKLIRTSIRKKPKVSQAEFGELVGATRDAIASYETGRVIPSDTFIQLICSKFHISENWLRTGEGEMYDDNANTALSELAQEYHLNEKEIAIAKYCLELTPQQRNDIMQHIEKIAEIISTPEQSDIPDTRATAHTLLDEELDAQEQDASASLSTVSEKRA